MAKGAYKIPKSLDRSFLDYELNLSAGGWTVKPAPVKQLLFFVITLMVLIWIVSETWINQANVGLIVLFVVWWLIAMIYFGMMTKTHEMKFMSVPAYLSYMPKAARVVFTRRDSNPSQFASIVGIADIEVDGRIRFSDGAYGQAYLVVGSASRLLFDEDRVAILDQVDAFWRNVDDTAEWTFLTTKEPQRIERQLAQLERQNRALESRDPDLLELLSEKYAVLADHVGGSFSSIHQYLLIRGKSADALRKAHELLHAEVEGKSQMFKDATMLGYDETITMLRVMYQSRDAHRPVSA